MAQAVDRYDDARKRLIDEIRKQFSQIEQETGLALNGDRVFSAMTHVPRHAFIPETEIDFAYLNRPLPIGFAQTISQPLIVALMTALADVEKPDTVLEVGTGSGYQAAILGELAGQVYSVEIVEPLGLQAAETLKSLGYRNVHTKIGDGHAGWLEHAPYDAIVVTAAPDRIPAALVEQLKPGGRLVIPVGEGTQDLLVVEKQADGTTRQHDVIPVRFVPLTGEAD